MKNKHNTAAFVLFMLLLLPAFSFSQDYESMPAEIQSKMNQNKIAGRTILDGVESVFLISVGNVNAQNATTLSNEMSRDESITLFNLSADNKSLTVTCDANTQIEDIKRHIAGVNGEIIQYTQSYRLR